MRRLPHGGTSRPSYARPGNGYGRPVRSGPPAEWRLPDEFRTDWCELLLSIANQEASRLETRYTETSAA
jgi:hypothetical protein